METPPTPLPENDPQPTPPASDSNLRQLTVAMHLSPLIGVLLPFGNIIAPLVLWLIKKTEIPALDAVGKTVLNYQISWTIWMVIGAVIGVAGSCPVVPIFVPFALLIAWLAFTIIGGVKASNNEPYAYPLTLNLLK